MNLRTRTNPELKKLSRAEDLVQTRDSAETTLDLLIDARRRFHESSPHSRPAPDAASSENPRRIHMATATATPTAAERPARPRFFLSERELAKYSLARGILTSCENMEATISKNCFELEVSESLARSHSGENHGGTLRPLQHRSGDLRSQNSEARGTRFSDRDERKRAQVHRAW